MKKFLFLLFIAGVASQNVDPMAFCVSSPAGLFAYPGTTNCTQYIKCYLYSGVMNGAIYVCAGSTRFNPAVAMCVTGYTCAAQTTTLAPTTSTTTLAPTTSTTTLAPTTSTTTLVPTTSTTTILPPVTTTSTLILTTTSTFKPTTTTIITTTLCPTTTSQSTTTTLPTTTTLSPDSFCATKAAGLYPYPGSQNCTQYIKCYLYNGVMSQMVNTCAGTTLFNPAQSLCVTGYKCVPQTTTTTGTTTTTSSVTTSTSSSTTSTSTETTTTEIPFDVNNFCSTLSKGYYDHNYNSTCALLIYCYPSNGALVGVIITGCTDNSLTTTTTIATTTTTVAPFDATQYCSTQTQGYYQVVRSPTCTSLVYCYNPSGTMMGTVVTECIELEDLETAVDTEINLDDWCLRMPQGDFPYPGVDDTCSLYVRCYLSNGVMYGDDLSCIASTLFNPKLGLCDSGFICEG